MLLAKSRVSNLLFYKTTLKFDDFEMHVALDRQLKHREFGFFMGIGEVDYLILLEESNIDFLNIRLPNVRS
jgi:hypothetical protein